MQKIIGAYYSSTAQFSVALTAWQAAFPKMGVLVLLPEAQANRVAELQSICQQCGVRLIGALFPAIVVNHLFVTEGLSALRFNVMPPSFLLTETPGKTAKLSTQMALETQKLLAALPDDATPTLFSIFDGMLPNIEATLTELNAELDEQVRYAGVNAGSETFKSMPCLFDNQKIIANGVLGFILPATNQVELAHGYTQSSTPLPATSSVANQVDTISDRPAFEIYQQMIRDAYGIAVTHENFYDYAAHFPFGIMTVCDILVRIPIGFNEEGALFFIGEIPTSSLIVLLTAPSFENSQCVESLSGKLAPIDVADADSPLLVFYCAGRKMHFQLQADQELLQLKKLSHSAALLGAVSLGEIDTIPEIGMPRFHNAAIVCVR